MIAIKNADGTLVPVVGGVPGDKRTVALSLVHSNQKRAEIQLFEIAAVSYDEHPPLAPDQKPFGVLVLKKLPENPFGEAEITATIDVDDDLNVHVVAEADGIRPVSSDFRLPGLFRDPLPVTDAGTLPTEMGDFSFDDALEDAGLPAPDDDPFGLSDLDSGLPPLDSESSADGLDGLDLGDLDSPAPADDDLALETTLEPEDASAPGSGEALAEDDPFGLGDLDGGLPSLDDESRADGLDGIGLGDLGDLDNPAPTDDDLALETTLEPEDASAPGSGEALAEDDPFGLGDLDGGLPSLDDESRADGLDGIDLGGLGDLDSPAPTDDDPLGLDSFETQVSDAALPEDQDLSAPDQATVAAHGDAFIDDPDDTDWGFDELADPSDEDSPSPESALDADTGAGLPDFDDGAGAGDLDLGDFDSLGLDDEAETSTGKSRNGADNIPAKAHGDAFIDDPDDTDWGFDELSDPADEALIDDSGKLGSTSVTEADGFPDLDDGTSGSLDLGGIDDDDFGADMPPVAAERSQFSETSGAEKKSRPVRKERPEKIREERVRHKESPNGPASPWIGRLMRASIVLFGVSIIELGLFIALRLGLFP